jgi:phosphinothricin acetyltransferase
MIRPATPADAAAIIAIYNPYVADTIITFETAPVSAEEMAGRIQRITGAYPWYVCEADGAVVGYAYASQWKERSAYRFSVETTVYVAPDHYRQGIGASLYRTLLPELRARGFHTALGGISLPNEGSVALHEHCGFRHVGALPEVGWKLDRWVDVGYWAAVL